MHVGIIQEKNGRERKCYCNTVQILHPTIHPSTHSFNASQCLLGLLGVGVGVTLTRGHRWTWEAGVAGCCHPDRTRSNVRLDHSRFAKVRSRRFVPSAAASMSLRSQAASPRPLFHVSQGSESTRPSGSASRCPALGGEELPLPPPHARKDEGKEARKGGRKVQDWFWWHVGKAHEHGSEWCGSVNAPRVDGIRSSGADCCTRQLWIPCATLRIVINTLHCSEDAPS